MVEGGKLEPELWAGVGFRGLRLEDQDQDWDWDQDQDQDQNRGSGSGSRMERPTWPPRNSRTDGRTDGTHFLKSVRREIDLPTDPKPTHKDDHNYHLATCPTHEISLSIKSTFKRKHDFPSLLSGGNA